MSKRRSSIILVLATIISKPSNCSSRSITYAVLAKDFAFAIDWYLRIFSTGCTRISPTAQEHYWPVTTVFGLHREELAVHRQLGAYLCRANFSLQSESKRTAQQALKNKCSRSGSRRITAAAMTRHVGDTVCTSASSRLCCRH